jgi:hypothetical protein
MAGCRAWSAAALEDYGTLRESSAPWAATSRFHQPTLTSSAPLLVNVDELLQVIHSPNVRGPRCDAASQLDNVVITIESMVSQCPVRAVAACYEAMSASHPRPHVCAEYASHPR